MKHKNMISFFLLSAAILITGITGCDPSGKVIPYPAVPGLVTSPDFTVTVNGTEVWVERVGGAEM